LKTKLAKNRGFCKHWYKYSHQAKNPSRWRKG